MIYLGRRPPLDEIQIPETNPTWRRGGVREFFRPFGSTVGGISTGSRFIVALALSLGIGAMQVWTYALQTQQVIPVTLLGVALAPKFIFKRRTRAMGDDR